MPRPFTSKGAALAILAYAEVAAMALWFSASAVLPALRLEADLSDFQQSVFTSAVQAGFDASVEPGRGRWWRGDGGGRRGRVIRFGQGLAARPALAARRALSARTCWITADW